MNEIKVNASGPTIVTPSNESVDGVLFAGKTKVTLPDGTIEYKDGPVALCACGQSSNKPYCDGTHKH